MAEWKMVKTMMDDFKCPKCGKESHIRLATKKKLCKGCMSVFER